MARLYRVNERHVLERAVERCGRRGTDAAAVLDAVARAVTERAPGDWRFTRNPHGKFIIACGDGLECRLVGRTWRDRDGAGTSLVERLAAPEVKPGEFDLVRDGYLELVRHPGCDIFHELKTCYDSKRDLSDEKRFFLAMKGALAHTVLIDERRVASRPNALVDGGELWVRQGEAFDISLPADRYQESLLFARLSPDGPDWARVRIYRIDRQGNLRLEREDGSPSPARPVPAGAPGERSQSYWMLPTYVDARRMDLVYSRDNWRGDGDYRLDATAALLLARLEAICRPS
jgi:hypothetical protein